MFTKEMIKSYADKLLIGLSDEETDILLDEFDVIKENMEFIASIPGIEKVKPQSFPTEYKLSSLREDKATSSLKAEDAFLSCGAKIENMVEVPKVVES